MKEENPFMKQRLEKLRYLVDKGINPYPYEFDKKNEAKEILEKFSKLKKEESSSSKLSIAGRVMNLRIMGKSSFAHLQDQTGRIQIYAQQNNLKNNYDLFKKLDLGDIIGVNGTIFKTKTGEITVLVKKFEILCKNLSPLPEKWHGLKDIEARYRQRYLDIIVNPEVKDVFIKRGLIIKNIREFLEKKGYIEVDTPILQPIYGGTNARPFKTHLNDLKMTMYLRIANELYLKRLIVGGFEKIFEFSKDFRNEGIDSTHNPEFTLMETMCAYKDYHYNMDFTEEMVEYVAKKTLGTTKIKYKGQTIDVKRPWNKITVVQAIKKYGNLDVESMSDKDLKQCIEKNKFKFEGSFSRGKAYQILFEELAEHKIIQPTIVYDFPHETCVLAKPKREDPFFAERFEPYIFGWEIGNSYSEENRPEILRQEWEKQEKEHKKGDEESQRMDEDFIKALEVGLPPVSGLGIGVDRLVMILTGAESIKDVILFPMMKK